MLLFKVQFAVWASATTIKPEEEQQTLPTAKLTRLTMIHCMYY